MKLRTDGRSVRLRLRRSEVEAFTAEGSIAETVPFAGRSLRFSLETGGTDTVAASFDGSAIRICVSTHAARHWAESDEVGIYGSDRGLELAIEKDFRRTSRSSPNDADLYPNPDAKCT